MGFLSLNNFLEVIQNFPMDYVLYIFKSIEIKFLKEIFCKLKDELEIYNQQDIFKIKCESCNKPNHNVTNCPLLTFKKNREKAIQNHFDNMEFQNRKNFKRQPKKLKVRTGYKKFVLNHQKFLLQNDQLCYKI